MFDDTVSVTGAATGKGPGALTRKRRHRANQSIHPTHRLREGGCAHGRISTQEDWCRRALPRQDGDLLATFALLVSHCFIK
ncbi:hypothetical protein FQY83_05235 [Luteimonas marina]|uniref:Uncharacterized protein n=1 Tax=Luteimonas marina TaxID=488485 RepID=A0A5C5UA72_9GAMM|nr:hypothetical protein [Luteimonas marina]TWT22430.1 hypothetical protein FQY83_05235 [Luteimonas marina]